MVGKCYEFVLSRCHITKRKTNDKGLFDTKIELCSYSNDSVSQEQKPLREELAGLMIIYQYCYDDNEFCIRER
jgi:hypothetical protein